MPRRRTSGGPSTIGRAVGDPNRQALALHFARAACGAGRGEYRESLELASEEVRLAREHRLVIPLLRCLWNQGRPATTWASTTPALAALDEGLALAEKIGDDAFIPRFLNTLGLLRIECGDFDRGIELSERSYEATGRSSRAGHGTGAERRAFIRNNEADAFMAQGRSRQRRPRRWTSRTTIVQHPPPSRWMTWRYTTHCYASLGQLALLRGDPDGPGASPTRASSSACRPGSRKFESWAWRIKGESATARHAWGEAEEALRRALALARRSASRARPG